MIACTSVTGAKVCRGRVAHAHVLAVWSRTASATVAPSSSCHSFVLGEVASHPSKMIRSAESATLHIADGSHMNASNHCTNGHGTGFGPACITNLNAAISLND